MLFKLLRVLAITAPLLAMTSLTSAQTTPPRHVSLPKTIGVAKPETVSSLSVVRDMRKTPSPVDGGRCGCVLRQDLFDRNDANNLRSDYPGPPAQPSQF
ncbi:hypothetical protein RAD16_27075 [Bradyrhizobium sp. 18BD]